MRKYWQFFKMGFQQFLEYRLNFVWSTAGNIISTLILYLFWTAILSSNPSRTISGFSLGNYYLLISIIGALTFSNFRPMADDIWEGDLAIDLLRPYNYVLKHFLFELPYKITRLVLGIMLILLVGSLTGFKISVPNAILLSISVTLAVGVKFYLAFLIAGLAFWFKRVHGFNALIYNFGGLFSGELIPLVFLPPALDAFSHYLPFRYLAYFPVQLALGQLAIRQSILGFAVLVLWLALVVVLNKLVWAKGLSQFEASGR